MAALASTSLFQLLPRGSIREAVVGRILSAVVKGEFPTGHRLIVQPLAEQFGVSATPVREALFELEGIGIVDLLPNRGAVLREFGARQLREIYQVRRVLEVEAIRCAFGRVNVDTLHEIEEELRSVAERPREAAWSRQAMELDIRLHATIAEACGSARLQHELDRYNTLMQVIREVVKNEQQAQDVAVGAHLGIIREIRNGTVDSAAAAMALHIDTTAVLVAEAMFPDAATAAAGKSNRVSA